MDALGTSVAALVQHAVVHARTDGHLRKLLTDLHHELSVALDALDQHDAPDEGDAPSDGASADTPAVVFPTVVVPAPPPAPSADQLAALKAHMEGGHFLQSAKLEVFSASGSSIALVPDSVLDPLPKRFRLKAEAARWVAITQRLLLEGADYATDIVPKNKTFYDQAKRHDTWLWMLSSSAPEASAWIYDEVGNCFETLAEGVEALRTLLGARDGSETFRLVLGLVAEMQSALRAAIGAMKGQEDPDQKILFEWIRSTAETQRIYIDRHMRLNDPADPTQSAVRRTRLAELVPPQTLLARTSNDEAQKVLKALRYHAQQIQKGAHDLPYQWDKVQELTAKAVDHGLPPSNVDLRAIWLPLYDHLPEQTAYPASVRAVLRELDRFLATREAEHVPEPEQHSVDVQRVGAWLEGRSVLFIGGVPRPHQREALRRAFKLQEVVWPETREHESIDHFLPVIQRPEVALALLAIRFSSHSYGDVKAVCDEAGKPLIYLPAGYNPNQVARQIVEQASTLFEAVER